MNLQVWKSGIELVKRVYLDTESFPAEEQFGLTSQIRRAAVSIPANIAEGAARGSKKEFRQFLIIARGSLSELDTLLLISKEVGLLVNKRFEGLHELVNSVSAMMSGLLKSLSTS
ncbi:MAG: four helix bundle protein [Acidobacteriota bacterium]|jgi:four helix bundle protein